jgi:hypothetical protein
MKIPLVQDQAIAARMALIVGADKFDRLTDTALVVLSVCPRALRKQGPNLPRHEARQAHQRRDARQSDYAPYRREGHDAWLSLDVLRNSFAHFRPQGWSIERAGLPRIVSVALRGIEQLMFGDDLSYKLSGNRKRDLQKGIDLARLAARGF